MDNNTDKALERLAFWGEYGAKLESLYSTGALTKEYINEITKNYKYITIKHVIKELESSSK